MWSDLAAWFASPPGQRALTDAVLPVAAILIAALLAALIARSAVRRLERRLDQESLTAAIAGFAEAARRMAAGDPDPGSAARLATESDVRLRLSGRAGAELAAEWALLVSLAARGDDAAVVRHRLLAWVRKPSRARRLFATDLDALHQPQAAEAQAASGSAPTGDRAGGADGTVERPAAVAAAAHANQVARPSQAEAPEVPVAPELQPAPLQAAPPQPASPLQPAALQQSAQTGGATTTHAWLDDYDDDAHVTRNIPLSTPAPVSASAVRDRGRPGDDIVPS